MAREDVNIKVTANVAEAIQLWKAMEAGPQGMANALDAMGSKGQKSTKGMADELVGMIGKWASIGTAVAAVTSAINTQYEAVKRLREEKTTVTNSVDEVWNRFQVQSGLRSGPQADSVRNDLFKIIATRKTAPISGFEAAEQLGSAGASVQDITGGGLDEFLKLVTASNAAGKQVNQAELAKSMVLFLKANGLEPNRQGMGGTSRAIQQLFGGTNLQLSNLNRFAPEAGKIATFSHMKPEDQLAQFSMLLDSMDEATAAIAFRQGIVSLATAGGTPKKKQALKDIGLTPADVDFQGEDWQTVYARLQKGFGSVPGERANIAAKKIFGDEGLPFYTMMLQPGALEEARKRGVMARDPTGITERLATAESSRAASAREAQTLSDSALYDPNNKDPDVIRKRMQRVMANVGLSEGAMARVNAEFDDPGGPLPDVLFDTTAEGKARRAAFQIRSEYASSFPFAQSERQAAGQRALIQLKTGGIDQQLLGTQRIQIQGPDGLDLDHSQGSPAHDLSR